MALETQVLKGRHGVALYSVQSAEGTAVTPATAVGLCSFDMTSDADTRSVFGLGSANALFFKPGLNVVQWAIRITQLQTKALLTQAVRASGALPILTLGFGTADDAGTKYAYQVRDCKIGQVDISCAAGQTAAVTLSGLGGLITNPTTLVAANLSPTPFLSYEGVLTKAGSAYESTSIRISVNHNLEAVHVLWGAAPSTFKRGFKTIVEGAEVITGEITRYQRSAQSMQADTFTDFALSFALTDIAGGMSPNAATIALANAQFGQERLAIPDNPSGNIIYSTPVMAKTWAVS